MPCLATPLIALGTDDADIAGTGIGRCPVQLVGATPGLRQDVVLRTAPRMARARMTFREGFLAIGAPGIVSGTYKLI